MTVWRAGRFASSIALGFTFSRLAIAGVEPGLNAKLAEADPEGKRFEQLTKALFERLRASRKEGRLAPHGGSRVVVMAADVAR